MNISTLTEPFVLLLKQNKLIVKRETEDKYKLIMLSLFKDLLEAEKYIKTCPITTVEYDNKEQNKEPVKPLTNNSRFFPKAIRKYIQETPYSLTKYNCQIKGRENNVYFYMFEKNSSVEIKHQVKLVFIWLYICIKYAEQKCAQELNIHIYLTPFKKTLPDKNTTIISAEHVNTAFTYSCLPAGDITIFREEEWFKVFLHETFHAYNLDFGLSPDSTVLRRIVESVFHIKSDFNINEAYTETWARIINCVFYSFASLNEKEKNLAKAETFLIYADFCLQVERLFSLFQMKKILNFMGLNYADISSSDAYLKHHLYKEDTHVFGYYILTGLFLNDYKAFMQWCLVHNSANGNGSANGINIMKFNCQKESFQKMGLYIQRIYTEPNLLSTIALLKKMPIKSKPNLLLTSRMTIIDLAEV